MRGCARRSRLPFCPSRIKPANPAREYLSDGVTEEMINGLARVEGDKLKVIGRTSAMSFKSSGKSVAEITKELGVEYALEGSVKEEGNHLHVTAELIRGDNQTYVWADSFDGDSEQILEFENHLTDAVARSLSLTLLAEKAPEHIPISNEAHEAYLQGLYFLAQRSNSGLENALQRFGTAVAKDPQYARAYAQLAVTYNLLGQFSWMSTDEAHSQARAAALQAIAADSKLAEAYAALGFNSWFYEWNSRAGEDELLQAIHLEPTNVDARHWYALITIVKRKAGGGGPADARGFGARSKGSNPANQSGVVALYEPAISAGDPGNGVGGAAESGFSDGALQTMVGLFGDTGHAAGDARADGGGAAAIQNGRCEKNRDGVPGTRLRGRAGSRDGGDPRGSSVVAGR